MSRLTHWQIAIALAALCFSFGIAGTNRVAGNDDRHCSGNVAQTLSLMVADLKRYPAHQVEYVPRNSTEEKGAGPARRYTGCLLRDVLAAAKPTESKPRELRKSYVVATASDEYEVVFSWAELFVSPVGDSVLVVYERDGAPIPDDEGRIALIAVTDTSPVRHVKWLRSLALRSA